MREFTPIAIILGVIIAIIFGAANAYIGLKLGMTVSASIPAAVISMAVLRGLLKRGTLLENNIVQTIGSSGESLAAGMIFTIPAILIMSYWAKDPALRPTFIEMIMWGCIGGLIGIFAMIPLRRRLIVEEHGTLPFPEGTACAEVLNSGERGGQAARLVFWGLGTGACFELLNGLGFWKEQASQRLPVVNSQISLSPSPALLGVGYILGPRIAATMLGGAVLGWFGLVPLITYLQQPPAPAPTTATTMPAPPGSATRTPSRTDRAARAPRATPAAPTPADTETLAPVRPPPTRSVPVPAPIRPPSNAQPPHALPRREPARPGAAAAEPAAPLATPTTMPARMSPDDLRGNFIRYIGAGAVIFGGVISLLRSLGSVWGSLAHLAGASRSSRERTDRDLPLPFLLLGIAALAAVMWYFPQFRVSDAGTIVAIIACVLVFGFFFVNVSSRLTGTVGSSSNPASGMTIATILGTALIGVYALHWQGPEAKFAILAVGALVCIAICMAGDCAQDLKTGYLVGATPWKQQVGEIIGVLVPVAVIAGLILLIDHTYGFVKDDAHLHPVAAPQANVMYTLVEGVVGGKLPWALILSGMGAALVCEMLGVASLPFAVGLYLPLSLTTPIMVGGLVRWLIERRRESLGESDSENPGVLASSGLVAGQGIMGVLLVGAAAFIGWGWKDPTFQPPGATVAELTRPTHFKDWLATRGVFDAHYGLDQYDVARGAFTGDYTVHWFDLLPLAPFLLLTLWLIVAARQPLPPRPVLRPKPPEPDLSPVPLVTDPLDGDQFELRSGATAKPDDAAARRLPLARPPEAPP